MFGQEWAVESRCRTALFPQGLKPFSQRYANVGAEAPTPTGMSLTTEMSLKRNRVTRRRSCGLVLLEGVCVRRGLWFRLACR
jgi:hypothetical protein